MSDDERQQYLIRKRRHISTETKLAATLLKLGDIPYDHAKLMSADQIISLYEWDHNILHETGHPDRDEYWNLKPMLIAAHRAKTKIDAKIIAKGRRLRIGSNVTEALGELQVFARPKKKKRKIMSRGFDKRFRRKMDGTVVKR